MKLNVKEDGTIEFLEVFNGVSFTTPDGEHLSICMRDSGFEFQYMSRKYEAKNGLVKCVKTNQPISGDTLASRIKSNLVDIQEYWENAIGSIAHLQEIINNYLEAVKKNDMDENICLCQSLDIYYNGKKKRVLPF